METRNPQNEVSRPQVYFLSQGKGEFALDRADSWRHSPLRKKTT